jgi:hypothetical protein
MKYFNYLLVLVCLIRIVTSHLHTSIEHDNLLNSKQEIDLVKLNLSFKDKYYFYLDKSGLFYEVNNLILTYLHSILEEKQFVLVDKDWTYQNWNLFFESFCEIDNTHIKNENDSIYPYNHFWYKIRTIENITKKSKYFKTTDFHERLKIIAEVIFKPKYNVNNINIPESYIGVHVRSGDKLISEMQNIPVSTYVNSIILNSNKYNITSIYYASDDVNKIKAIISQLPLYNHYTLNTNKFGHQESFFNQMSLENKQHEFSILMNDIMFLKNSLYFIGTYTSNLSRFVASIRSLDSCTSLDTKEWHAT